ncbi:JmjC domain-containing protein [Nocardioides sp.]|uniref:JmjC domain-containing protein n=1 Tax=Nocardioides sp. TaxID=35761 RepID=UPI003518BBF9
MPDLLTAEAAQLVARAAAANEFVVVDHRVPDDVIPGPAEQERLAAELPKHWVRGMDSAPAAVAPYGRELGAVLPHQVDRPAVTRLYHVHLSPRFRALTDAVYGPLEAAWSPTEPWTARDAGFFISSLDGTTPAHADAHHNLLVQIRGAKEIGIALPGTREHAAILAATWPTRRAGHMPAASERIELTAGQALYLPPYALHWVRSTEESVALSCGWSSHVTAQLGEAHAANATLRKVGLPPTGVPGRWDAARIRAADAARAGRRRVSRLR